MEVILGADPVVLNAEDGIAVNGTMDDPEGTIFSPSAQLVAQVASRIPGRASVQLDADVSDSMFRLGMARSLLDASAMIRLLPPADAPQQPPFALSAPLRDGMSIMLPRRDQMTTLRGRLLDSLGMVASGYTAQAKADMTIVSNTATTDDGGAFELLIAPGAIPASANGLITIELSKSSTQSGSVPTFVTTPFAPVSGSTSTVTTYNLPAFVSPVLLHFTVQTSDATPRPIAGATLRFRTSIDAAPAGTAVFVGEGRTDATGDAPIALIPGTSQEPRMYDVSIIPPPNSGLSTECMTRLPVLAPTSNSTQYAATFVLLPRAKLSGVVTGNDGRPGMDVTVTATVQADSTSCPELVAAAPASTTTDATGHYELSVDPGSYRLDVRSAVRELPAPRDPRRGRAGRRRRRHGAGHPAPPGRGGYRNAGLRDRRGGPDGWDQGLSELVCLGDLHGAVAARAGTNRRNG